MKKLEAYYYHSTTKPNKNHTTHTINTPKAQPSAPKFRAKTTTSHLQQSIINPQKSQQLTVVNLQSQTTN